VALRDRFAEAGLAVETVPALARCEDMVFCANPPLPGLDRDGRRTCVASRMRHPSRQPEVAAATEFLHGRGYRVVESPCGFEGGGDALWHPGRALLWGGVGPRTEMAAYPFVARTFGVPVAVVELASETFYHLDTCLAPLDERTVLVYAPALAARSLALVRALFPRVVEVTDEEAHEGFACNAAAHGGRIFLPAGNDALAARLRAMGFPVVPVDTGEFKKSGGSVFCMKQWRW
jgi:N-dimethylarginine dimethylaminohydrolase